MPAIERSDSYDDAQRMTPRLAGARVEQINTERASKQALIRLTKAEMLAEQQALVLSVLSELLDSKDQQQALDGFLGALQQRFSLSRASLAIVTDDGSLKLQAISQQAHVELASNEVRLILDVMNDSLEQERIVCFPNLQEDAFVSDSIKLLGTRQGQGSLAIVPLFKHTEPVGVLLLERSADEPFVASTIRLLEKIAAMSAPTIYFCIEANRTSISRAATSFRKVFIDRPFVQRIAQWIAIALALALLLFSTLMPLNRTVTANAELVPLERRLVTVPFDGFVDSVSVQPGEQVLSGQLLAQLERRELQLEEQRRDGEIASAEAEFRAAMFSHDRQATAIARARLERERALRAMVNQRLERIDIRAPISGLIVSGDPKDAIGAPVSRGETLFEIARPDGYEVQLMVHEKNIREVEAGQEGALSLRARPGQDLDLNIHTIHPVAESLNGASYFRVRATLSVPAGVELRPGESGVAKLNVGQDSLIKLMGRPLLLNLHELWWRIIG